MQHNTTDDGRTDRRTYLKSLGAGALATGMGSIAGCLGASDSGNGDAGGGVAEADTVGSGEDGSDAATNGGDDGTGDVTATENAGESDETGGTSPLSCRNDDAVAAIDTSGFETYTNSSASYSIKYPVDWEVDDDVSSDDNLSVMITGGLTDRVLVYSEKAGGRTVDEIVKSDTKYLGEDTKVVCQKQVTLSSGLTGTIVETEFDDGTMNTTTKTLYITADGTAYKISWTPTIFTEDNQYLHAIAGSFTVEETG